MSITEQIEDLIERKASDFEISKLFKSHISDYKNSLPELFERNQGKDFLVIHTKTLDSIISLMYKTVLRRLFGNYLPMRSSIPIAFIALGSYGREQLCVHSDIDLMIVYEQNGGYNTSAIIEKFLYLAWDAGLKLGHRVHEVGDLFNASREDITIKTAMMESRLIIGSSFTWSTTQNRLNAIRHDNPKAFIMAKIEEAELRRKKFPSSMQPHIKEGVGGLRDSQLLYWIAKTLYGVNTLKELTGILFSEEQYREYRIALELLFRVRSALHLISGKQQDQLVLDYMPRIAQMLGFSDERRLVTKLLEAQWRINNFTQIYVKKMARFQLYHAASTAKIRAGRIQKGFYAVDGTLYASYNATPPSIDTLLELLISLEDREWKFDSSVLFHFTYSPIKHPLKVKTYTLLRKLFERNHLYVILKLFYDAGILHHLIGAFKKVLHLPQFDGYHLYPVDLHSIKCIEALEKINDPYVEALYKPLSVSDKLLLKAVILLHDTGKGRKQDHSEVGTKLIVPFLKNLKLPTQQYERGALLVRHHILMSNVAYRENLYHEKTLYQFMSKIKTPENLTLLYILTYADINGVGPGTYTSFGANLLHELYEASLEIASQNDRITDAIKRVNKEKKLLNDPDFTQLSKVEQKKVLSIESNLFFFKHTPSDILAISKEAFQCQTFTYQLNIDGGLIIHIFRKIPLNLGYLLGKLSYLDVASMDIFTLFDSIKYFKIEFLQRPREGTMEQIEMIVEEAFDMTKKIDLPKPVIKPNEITIDCDHSIHYAQLNLNTTNQRGLLAYFVQCFDEANINIATAKIHTNKNMARDHFLIEKQHRMCDNAREIINKLVGM
ncbi:HD domain-containing protein [Sulfuricurvum sp.]|uniref:[protein-PII] uridylyltransferase family protein n=1 Tax=Sulfuricurvum sp. TaxID=2025608 RepID=UPI00261E4BA0|nr:HD domain-containing protein [Sulfuricurvum sp.]MDD2265205.1 HD domain-containing protein [Sulfuricurvum sp.]MDD2784727.1 HD domain-containing protein [Sulfuricurvum sp.]